MAEKKKDTTKMLVGAALLGAAGFFGYKYYKSKKTVTTPAAGLYGR
jgi:predicted negative regulator of RcsB-dependent stress response